MNKTHSTAKYGSGYVYKRGKSRRYYAKYSINGEQITKRLLDNDGQPISARREAEKALKALLSDKENRTKNILNIVNKSDSLPLIEVWDEYYSSQNRPKSGDMTLKRYKAVVNTFIIWVAKKDPATKTMRQVRTEHAEAYAHHLEQRSLSPSSFNIYFNSLSTVWAVLAIKGNLTSNPFAWDKTTRTGIQRKNIKAETSRRKKRPLTLQEITDTIEIAEGSYKTLLILLTFTGQRLVDCVKLQWKSINLQQKIITLIPQKTARRTGKEVLIPILPELEAELSKRNRRTEYVLPDLVDVYNRNPPAITKKIRSILTSAGINAKRDTDFKTIKAIAETGSQSFRHSFVSLARMHNIPDGVIQTITGHESIELINHYTTITTNDIEALSASLPTLGSKIECQSSAKIVPSWIKEILKGMTVDNWQLIKEQLIEE